MVRMLQLYHDCSHAQCAHSGGSLERHLGDSVSTEYAIGTHYTRSLNNTQTVLLSCILKGKMTVGAQCQPTIVEGSTHN